ncbi:MAG: hypothetical protein CMJ18_26010 [Phycisphaeraceae bacterium]|nr:hypothetical protein [Phycisphaeraceae bacterium]
MPSPEDEPETIPLDDEPSVDAPSDDATSDDAPVVRVDRPQSPTSSTPDAPRDLRDLDRSGSRLLTWSLLLVVLAVSSAPLLIDLHRPAVYDAAEAQTVATSLQTWNEHFGVEREADLESVHGEFHRLVPYLNQRRHLREPPGTTWMHLVAFTTLRGTDASTDQFVLRARVVSVVFALFTIAAVFWAGHSIGGLTPALLSALVCAANPVFMYHARLATPPTQHAGWTMFSIAAALWAIRPLRPAPSVERQFIGWVSSGIALGAAIMTGGPWGLLHFLAIVLVLLILCPGRTSHLMGLLAAVLIGTLVVIPWAVYADEHDPQAHVHWLRLMAPTDWTDMGLLARQAGERTGILLIAMLPWTLWIIGAVVQPFSTSSSGSRLRMLLGWSWFVVALVMVVLNPKEVLLADQLVILPAVAILVGQLFRQYNDLASEGRHARFWRLLNWPHLLLLTIGSAAIPALLYVRPHWLGIDVQRYVERPMWYYPLGLGIILLTLVFLSLRWVKLKYPARAMTCWAVWTIVLIIVVAIPVARGPAMNHTDGEKIAGITMGLPLYWLRNGGEQIEPDPILLLYSTHESEDGRIVSKTPDEIAPLLQEAAPFVVAAPREHAPPNPERFSQTELRIRALDLWHFDPSKPKPDPIPEPIPETETEPAAQPEEPATPPAPEPESNASAPDPPAEPAAEPPAESSETE